MTAEGTERGADPATGPPVGEGDRLASLPTPADPDEKSDVLWQELQNRFAWYDRAAKRNRTAYQALKVVFLLASSSVTVLAAFSVNAVLTAILAGGLIVVEGVQQLFRFHANWIAYRGTAETLRAHTFAYVLRIDPYDEARSRRSRMATFLRDLALRENSSWSRTMRTANPRSTG
jgi:hypothetical protein